MTVLDPEKSQAEDLDLNNKPDLEEDLLSNMGYQHPDQEPEEEKEPEKPEEKGSQLKDTISDKAQNWLREGNFKEGSLLDKAQKFQGQVEKAREDFNGNLKNTAKEILGKKSPTLNQVGKTGVENTEKAIQEGAKKVGKNVSQDVAETGAKTALNNAAQAGAGEAAQAGAGVAAEAAAGAEAGAIAGSEVPIIGNIIGAAIGFLAATVGSFLVKHAKDIAKFVVIGFVVVALIIFIVIAAIAGKTAPLTPANANEKQEATAVAAEAGDSQSLQKITSNVIQAQQARYQIIEGWVGQVDSGDLSNLKTQDSQINNLMNQALAQTNAASKQKTFDQLIGMIAQTDATLPFGTEITSLAKADVGKSDKNFCNVSSAFSSDPCTNFIYDVLYQAGVPGVLVSTDTDLWNDPSLTKVVPRSTTLSTTSPPVGELQPGDIIFFGDGTYSSSSNPNPLFDHAGIYIGNNQMVDSNSNTGLVTEESMMEQTSSGNYAFNGAERYGK